MRIRLERSPRSTTADLHYQHPDHRQRHADTFPPGHSLVQKDPGENRDLKKHRIVNDGGLHRREGPQCTIPECECERTINDRQPKDDEPVHQSEAGQTLCKA